MDLIEPVDPEREALMAKSVGMALLVVLDKLAPAQRVDAFLQAARGGDFERLLALLDPEVVLRADDTAARMGIPRPQAMRGPQAVAGLFSGAAQTLETALIDGTPGLVWAVRGVPRVVFTFEFRDARVTRIDQIADREAVARFRVELDV